MSLRFPRNCVQWQPPRVTTANQTHFDKLKYCDVVVLNINLTHFSPNVFRDLKDFNPDIKIFIYWSAADYAWGANAAIQPVEAAFNTRMRDDYTLKDANGQAVWLYDNGGYKTLIYNQTLPAMRNLWTTAWLERVEGLPIDGCFFDWSQRMSWLNDADPAHTSGADLDYDNDGVAESDILLDQAWISSLRSLAKIIKDAGYRVMGNGGYETEFDFTTHYDGIMIEGFMESESAGSSFGSWARIMRCFGHYTAHGKDGNNTSFLMMNVTNASTPRSDAILGFCSAMLLGGGACMVNDVTEGSGGNYSTIYDIDEIGVNRSATTSWTTLEHRGYLGEPWGEAVDGGGNKLWDVLNTSLTDAEATYWKREFARGMVIANPTASSVAVTFPNAQFMNINGTDAVNNGANTTSYSVPAGKGLVLLRRQQ